MFKTKTHQKRALSASISSQNAKQGILSIKTQSKQYSKLNTQSNDISSFHKNKYSKKRHNTSAFDYSHSYLNRSNQKITTKPAQQLLQQNYNLKVSINDLSNKLNITRSRIQSQKKKHLNYSKKLNRQFQNQLYWNNNQHNQYLVTGIKHQYQKLKSSYQIKCQQLSFYKLTTSSTNIQQLQNYCQALQIQNKILIQNIVHLKKNKKKSSKNQTYQNLNQLSKSTQQDINYLLNQHKNKQLKYQHKIKSLQNQLLKHLSTQKQLNKKIHFLQKLIIQKQNQTHHSHKKTKTTQKQKHKLLKQISSFQSKFSQMQSKFQNQISQLKQTNNRQALVQKSMFQKLIKQKNFMIQKLQKQIAYLSTILSYWKPLDQLDKFDKLDQNSSQKQKTISLNSANNLNQSVNIFQLNANRQLSRSRTPVMVQSLDESNMTNQEKLHLKNSHRHDQQLVLSGKDSVYLTITNRQLQQNPIHTLGNTISHRQPHRSNKKWNNDAIKCRKVDHSQIQHLGQLIKYKMIARNKSIQQVKQYFSSKLPKSTTNKFQQQIITMKQVKNILMSQPFSLSQNDAFLLSRYIIQDQGLQYVYCHQANQLQRQIVKSIIKTIIGQYSLPDISQVQQKWQYIKKLYSHNLQLALKSICPKGTVTKNKFLQLINSLGIQTDDQTRNYLIGTLIIQSNSLQALKYDILFNPQQRIQ